MINMEFSNKTLAWLVVVIIVVSLGGTLISINSITGPNGVGHVTSNATGNASVSISSVTQLTFKTAALDFGTGQVNGSAGNNYQCNMSNNGSGSIVKTSGCSSTFNSTNLGGSLVIENTGNTALNVSLNFSANAANFLGGGATGCGGTCPAPLFKFTVLENESGSCPGGQNGYNATMNQSWVDVVAGSWLPICNGTTSQNLQYGDNNDSLAIGIFIAIPSDASGTKNVTITAQGTS
jgi:hypothetical protein